MSEEISEEFQEDQWDFYFQKVDGKPASIMLDFAFDGYAPMEGYPKLTMVFVDMEDGGEHGLGSEAEEADFHALETALENTIEAAGCYHVGRVRTQGQWHVSFYGPNDVDAEAMATVLLDEAGRDHSTVAQDDPEWNYFSQFLLPSDERRQWMADRTVVQGLVAAGDDLSKPRTIEHWVLFKTTQQRSAFLSAAKEAGFDDATAADDLDDSGEWKHPASVKREETPALDHMHGVAMAVSKLADECEGWYDGWGCEAVT